MDSDSVKKAIIKQVLIESNTANARQLIEKINENCFEKCIPKPGSSLSSGEKTCVTACMEKYMAAWNQVNKTYLQRIQQEVGNNSFST
ncbi:putative mitochondrial import inner membrane translocase [Diplogelasinospora grovesii]|uniref:Mitochondrial import inner membrane translocase subunit n=1 Tax=Diplogelasinospora grovesii TaxID=303347 RepID=A0AAN6NIH4_9PEZI|nr:putative mitochondrial import inner membrane translocase [Diplogelasinospora grovesii]